MTRFFAIAAAAALAIPAFANTGGWDWDLELTSREWNPASLNWAASIHPTNPSTQWLEQNEAPPPREMWCETSSGVADLPENCDIFDDLLDDWLHSYLDIPSGDPLPPNLPLFPAECVSACAP